MRSFKIIVAFCVLSLLLSSCGFKDLDRRFFVIAFGIDSGKTKKYEISLKLAIPSPKIEPGQEKDQVISEEADSIAEAVRRMKSKVDKEFDFGHCKILVIGKGFAEKHKLARENLDWIFRRRDIQQIAYIALGEPDAKSVLNTKVKSERLPGNALILALSREGTESPFIATVYLFDYYRRVRGYGKDPYLPVIRSLKDTFDISRAAVFQTGTIKLELSPEETSILNQVVRQYPHISLSTEYNGHQISVNVVQLKAKYRITGTDENPRIVFHVRMRGETEESSAGVFDKSWTKLEKYLEDQVVEDYTNFLRKLQQAKVDPIGFGMRYRAIRHEGHGEFDKWWNTVYPNVEFKVYANVEIRGTGIIK
ncbi:Ger(x)C family spore germination protein [Cohnella pontilimi]|uniref:Ger(X)C family spore germination protein n=1 Tax=Cohnella pontilimi TaxID=2564100 RepID=A0A4U0FGB7_9BACL|nr:Ger(x)C family spore germination protein [Cohnella pontilimi]TJY43965.1 Ger(x)C family spore germination protein [Cohnella pontilimi]